MATGLALAATAGVMLPGCDKDPIEQKPIYRAPYEKELLFDNYSIDSIKVPVVQKYADDTACKKIYLTVDEDNNFSAWNAEGMSFLRTEFLQPAVEVSPKVTGNGAIRFRPARFSIYPADSIWYVQNGWTFRQR